MTRSTDRDLKGHDHSLASEPHLQKHRPLHPSSAIPVASPVVESPTASVNHDLSLFAEPSMGGRGRGDWSQSYAIPTNKYLRFLLVMSLSLLAGPLAIATALLAAGFHSLSPLLNIIVLGPLIEEVAKVLPFLLLAERRPWWLPAWPLLLVAVALSALGFASIENLLYLHILIPDPTPEIIAWRWWICTALHMTCSLIAGVGLISMRQRAWQQRCRGQLEDALPWISAAAILHGAYNAFALTWELIEPF